MRLIMFVFLGGRLMVMEKVVRGDRSLAVPSLQKRKGKKIRFKEEICSRRERGRSPEHPRMIRPFLTGIYRTPQEKGTRQLKIKNENKKTK